MSKTFSQLLKDHRIRLGKTLREFCVEHGLDAGNYSKLERGLFPPPESEARLEKLAHAYKLKRGGEDWLEFFDLASVGRGEIPKDLLTDEEVVKKLPVIFRTLRGKPLPTEKQDALVERIRRT